LKMWGKRLVSNFRNLQFARFYQNSDQID